MRRLVKRPQVRIMSKGTSIYHANKGLLKAAGVVLAGIGVLGLVYYYRIPLDSPLEPAVDCVLRAFEEGRGLEPVNRGDFIDRKALIDKLSLILHPEESSSYVVIVRMVPEKLPPLIKRCLLWKVRRVLSILIVPLRQINSPSNLQIWLDFVISVTS